MENARAVLTVSMLHTYAKRFIKYYDDRQYRASQYRIYPLVTPMQRSQVTAIYVLVGSVLLVTSILAVLTVQWRMHGTGSVKGAGLGVYWDPECTDAASSLDFGLLELGFSKNFTLYLKNEGNIDLNLSMTSENWNPATAMDYMNLTWNREGQQIGPDELIGCVLTLSVLEDVQGVSSFTLDIIISGIG